MGTDGSRTGGIATSTGSSRARDRDAFDELYRRYAAAAYGLAFRVTGRSALAQDVVHDAFLALWRAPEAFDPARGTFRAYFLSLVHHRASTRFGARSASGSARSE